MADTIKTSENLGIGVEFQDGNDTRTSTITIPNFSSSITEQKIKQAFANQQVLIYGYDDNHNPKPVTSDNIVTASTTQQTINNIDIGWED